MRYLPDLLLKHELGGGLDANMELSLNTYATARFGSGGSPSYDWKARMSDRGPRCLVEWIDNISGSGGAVMKSSTLMFPNLVRARITPFTFVIGFLPGLLATFLGTAISGVGIYRRQTSELFKELES